MGIKKRVLLLAPPFMDMHLDIIKGLDSLGYDVSWVEDFQIEGNPYNKASKSRKEKTVEEYNNEVDAFWSKQFSEYKGSPVFDIFLAIDGMMVSPTFFQLLLDNNPRVTKVLYLYDKVEGYYELDCFFKYYDRIFTFDKSDSLKYGIIHMPYYWVPFEGDTVNKYDIFGMASYKHGERYEVFSNVRKLAIKEGLRENVHLWHAQVNNPFLYTIIYLLKRLLGRKALSLKLLSDDIFTSSKMSPEEFRRNIYQSKVVLDTNNNNQDGLTARFIWALSAGKKIIMTNSSVKNYPFYNSRQILLLDNNYNQIVDFIKDPFEMSSEQKEIILPYRIDNWLTVLLV